MNARIFVSYRSSDGTDKATALARDLGRVFGDSAVFLDKDDLAGGSAWAQEIGRAIGGRPVLLLLMTPGLAEARGADGRRRIEASDDPVRRELEAAFAAGAQVIPLLCDGLDAAPADLPPPFDRLAALTWRRLRAYDWCHDIDRLVADLRALGLGPAAPDRPLTGLAPDSTTPTSTPGTATAAATPRRRAVAAGALLLASAAAGLGGWFTGRRPADPAARLVGRWNATLWQGERTQLLIETAPQGLRLTSEPIAIGERADWADYRRFWHERFGTPLEAVRYRGAGTLRADPGEAPQLTFAIQIHTVPEGAEPIDGGSLSATLAADGRRLDGTLWLNGAQAQQPVTLQRE